MALHEKKRHSQAVPRRRADGSIDAARRLALPQRELAAALTGGCSPQQNLVVACCVRRADG
jgi:hypothetical protein